jgi:hypothetical protein
VYIATMLQPGGSSKQLRRRWMRCKLRWNLFRGTCTYFAPIRRALRKFGERYLPTTRVALAARGHGRYILHKGGFSLPMAHAEHGVAIRGAWADSNSTHDASDYQLTLRAVHRMSRNWPCAQQAARRSPGLCLMMVGEGTSASHLVCAMAHSLERRRAQAAIEGKAWASFGRTGTVSSWALVPPGQRGLSLDCAGGCLK